MSIFHIVHLCRILTKQPFQSFHTLVKMGSISAPTKNAASKLRDMIESPGSIILGPGVYDGFSARIALGVGFNVIYMV